MSRTLLQRDWPACKPNASAELLDRGSAMIALAIPEHFEKDLLRGEPTSVQMQMMLPAAMVLENERVTTEQLLVSPLITLQVTLFSSAGLGAWPGDSDHCALLSKNSCRAQQDTPLLVIDCLLFFAKMSHYSTNM